MPFAWPCLPEERTSVLHSDQPVLAVYDDASFDQALPRYERDRSSQYWTPVAVSARVAAIFSERGARKVLDVGCGPGKFCVVAGALRPDLHVSGIEQRPRLVRLGKGLVRQFGLRNVELSTGDATKVSWESFDGLYFFNPFIESTLEPANRFDDDVDHSTRRFGAELLRVESLLARAHVGTLFVTYHGLGGPIPSSYELVGEERAGTDKIHTWVKRENATKDWLWLETMNRVTRVSRSRVRIAQARLLSGDLPLIVGRRERNGLLS
jgi:SAM-dependent methyltransferase